MLANLFINGCSCSSVCFVWWAPFPLSVASAGDAGPGPAPFGREGRPASASTSTPGLSCCPTPPGPHYLGRAPWLLAGLAGAHVRRGSLCNGCGHPTRARSAHGDEVGQAAAPGGRSGVFLHGREPPCCRPPPLPPRASQPAGPPSVPISVPVPEPRLCRAGNSLRPPAGDVDLRASEALLLLLPSAGPGPSPAPASRGPASLLLPGGLRRRRRRPWPRSRTAGVGGPCRWGAEATPSPPPPGRL